MKRMTSLSLAVAFALASQPALALGLGSIQVRSALGQPLRAVIPVEVSKPGESKLLRVSLASPQAYERAGISLAQLATSLQFTVAKNAQGKPVIRVSTTNPVRAPYLDFLLEVNSPSGSILREYTVLLDPPGFNQIARTPQHGTVSTKPVTSPVNPSKAVTAPIHMATSGGGNASVPARSTASRPAGTYGPVQAGATLSAIAQATRPNGTSNDQMMLALLTANPHAFMHNNINELKRGAILRIPGQSEINRTSLTKARAEVFRQMRQWRSRWAKAPTLVARVGGRSNVTPAGAQPAPTASRLRLIPPAGKGGSAHSRPGVAGGTGIAGIARLKEDLARAKESLKSQQLHNADLSSRLSQLEKIQKENGKLLVMKNNEIAELQSKLTAMRAASQAAAVASHAKPAAAPRATSVLAKAEAEAKTKTAIPAAASTRVATTASRSVSAPGSKSVSSTAVHKPTSRLIKKTVPAKTSTPWYRQIYVLVGGAVILLGVLIGLLLRGRRNQSAIEPASSLADQFGDSGLDGADTEPSDEQSEVADTDDDEEDPEVTALHGELTKNPDDPGLYLELASLYYARQDNEHFEEVAEAMHEQVSTATTEWEAVATMGEEMLPQHPLFSRLVSDDEENDDGSTDIEALTQPVLAPEETDEGFSDEAFELPSGEVTAPPSDSLAPAAEPTAGPDSDWMSQESIESPVPQDDQEAIAVIQDPDQPADDERIVSNDPVETKLDLARAYLDMGDQEGAHSMLKEVLDEGSDVQKEEAQCLLEELH